MPSLVETVSAPTEPKAPELAYTQVPETQHDRELSQGAWLWICVMLTSCPKLSVDWADLVTLDLAKFDEPGGKGALAQQLFEALQTIGFFYIINFGLGQEEVDRQFAIGKAVFDLPTEEKLSYRADLENGGYNGYKPLGLRVRRRFGCENEPRDETNCHFGPPQRKSSSGYSTIQRFSTSPSSFQRSRGNSLKSSMLTGQR